MGVHKTSKLLSSFFIAFFLFPYSAWAGPSYTIKTYQQGYFSEYRDTKKCLAASLESEVFELCGCEASVEYPAFSGMKDKKAQSALNDFFLGNVKHHKCDGRKIKRFPELGERGGSSRKVFFQESFRAGDFLSMVKNWRGYNAGAAHDNPGMTGFIIDMERADIVDNSEIFGNDKENYKKLNAYLVDKLVKRKGTSYYYYKGEGMEKELVTEKDCNGCSFYIDSDAKLKISFNPYVVASFAAGIVEIAVPKKFVAHKELAGILRE